MTFTHAKLKPYQQVVLQNDGYSHLAETISYPTPDGTIMVRRVPGDPTTMIEVQLDKLSEATGKYRFVHYAKVHLSFDFPMDMLRYDFAAPVNFQLVEDDWGRVKAILNDGEDSYIVARAHQNKNVDPWTHARWNSFCARVEPMNVLKIEGR